MIGSFKAVVATALSLCLGVGVGRASAERVGTADSAVMGPAAAAFLPTTPNAAAFTPDDKSQSAEDFGQRLIKYSGIQLDGVLTSWDDSDPTPGAADVSSGSPAKSDTKEPAHASETIVNEVGVPAADWQIIAGLAITAAMVARMSRRSAIARR